MVFLKRPASYMVTDLDEYGNTTKFLRPEYVRNAETLLVDNFSTHQRSASDCVVGTIPSVSNISLNSTFRKNLANAAVNIDLGKSGIAKAYRRTPVYKLRGPGAPKISGTQLLDGVSNLQEGWNEDFTIRNVPYNYFEFISGKPLSFPLSLARIWELDVERRNNSMQRNIMDESDSESSASSSESEVTLSAKQGHQISRRSPRLRSQRQS